MGHFMIKKLICLFVLSATFLFSGSIEDTLLQAVSSGDIVEACAALDAGAKIDDKVQGCDILTVMNYRASQY